MNKTLKKVSIALIIFFLSLAAAFVEIYFAIERAERKEAEEFTAEYEPMLKAYITENAAAFERLAAYEIEHAVPENGSIYSHIDPYGEFQEERNSVYTVTKDAIVLSDMGGSNPRVMFISRAGINDVYVFYNPNDVGESDGKISDKLYYTSSEDPHY